MPDDIFDQITKPKGDIFDQIKASTPAPQPTPQSMGLPDAAQQAKQQFLAKSGLAVAAQPTERAMQQTIGGPPQFVDVPQGQGQAFTQAGQQGAQTGGKIGALAVSLPGMIANPVATAGAIGGGLIGGKVARAGAEKLGADKDIADIAEGGGNLAGGLAGGVAGGALQKYTTTPFVNWLTSSRSAGAQMLQAASAKAGSAPVELSPKTNEIVEEITKQGKLGGTVPKVITDLLERVGPSTKQAANVPEQPLTYDEARILQSNASTMSAQEQMNLKGQLKYLIPKFAKSFSGDVQAAADNAGVGEEHAAGMKEYATASSRDRALSNVKDIVTHEAVKKAALLGAGYYAAKKTFGK